MSTHRVDVIRIGEIEKHPNADSLGLVRVGGWTCAVRLGEWQTGDLAAFIEPDYVVPDVERFAFLKGQRRIKARRLRGVWSQGLLTRPPDAAAEGDDVMAAMGIERYEPQSQAFTASDVEPPHPRLAGLPKYDLESWQKYRHLLTPGEPVVITEKIHGASARYAWVDGRLWAGSRTQWKKPPAEGDRVDIWWTAAAQDPEIAEWCRAHEGLVLFGEVFGQVQDLKYGAGPGRVMFRAFDCYDLTERVFLDGGPPGVIGQAVASFHAMAPVVYEGPYDPSSIEALASGPSTIEGANHLREGIVIRPVRERLDDRCGRVVLKCVSNEYLERA